MNRKIIMILVIFFIFISSLIFYNVDKLKTNYRYEQHIEDKYNLIDIQQKENILETHLPIISINTNEDKISGEAIIDSIGNKIGETLSGNESTMTLGEIRVYDNKDINTIINSPTLESKIYINYRGNSSLYFSKKNYLIKLIDKDGNNKNEEMLGMSKDNEWVLNGPFLDKTLMRNYIAYNIGSKVMGYAPNVRYCEVYINDKYQGLYLLCESISRSVNRINIEKYNENFNDLGYIVCIDKNEENIKNITTFTEYTHIAELDTGIKIVYPGKNFINDNIKKYIESDFSKFERSLYSYDFKNSKKGYKKYINVNSFVDYYIFQEFMEINDTCYRSTYLYKEKGGKINMGPIWDYNNCLNNYFTELDYKKIQYSDRLWYSQLLKDEEFVDRVIYRYRELRKTVLNENYLLNYIDDVRRYLGSSVDRNFEVWGFSFNSNKLNEKEKLYPESRNIKSYDEAIQQLKDEIFKRGRWLDENIDTLYQYCQPSKNIELLQ